LPANQQELCQRPNKLMSLTFSSAYDVFFGPRRINHDCKTVPRRNSFDDAEDASESRQPIWILSGLDYDKTAGTKKLNRL
jgi:hypothetical protein